MITVTQWPATLGTHRPVQGGMEYDAYKQLLTDNTNMFSNQGSSLSLTHIQIKYEYNSK